MFIRISIYSDNMLVCHCACILKDVEIGIISVIGRCYRDAIEPDRDEAIKLSALHTGRSKLEIEIRPFEDSHTKFDKFGQRIEW